MTKPGDFLLGVLDFFAILLPGSMVTWLVTRYEMFRHLSFGLGNGDADPITLWSAFLLSSYVLGHFVFMAGSRLDGSYDRWRQRRKPSARDKTFQSAEKLMQQLTKSLVDGEFTTLKWAKAYIQIHAPNARSEIDRLEADSKFFRSLVVVSIAFALHFFAVERMPSLGIVSVVLCAMAYWRYIDQRWKMVELSYGTAVILHQTKTAVSPAMVGGSGRTDSDE